MNPLSAFWHRTRRQYVPLTGDEWERKASITTGNRIIMSKAGMVMSSQTSNHGQFIYEITPAGIEAHRASIVRAAT